MESHVAALVGAGAGFDGLRDGKTSVQKLVRDAGASILEFFRPWLSLHRWETIYKFGQQRKISFFTLCESKFMAHDSKSVLNNISLGFSVNGSGSEQALSLCLALRSGTSSQ